MFFISEYVDASDIWEGAKNFTDQGWVRGYVRGYNIEVKSKTGETFWWSCEYISDTPEETFADEFHMWLYDQQNCVPTGRICFRGYGVETYDAEEHETYIKPVEGVKV